MAAKTYEELINALKTAQANGFNFGGNYTDSNGEFSDPKKVRDLLHWEGKNLIGQKIITQEDINTHGFDIRKSLAGDYVNNIYRPTKIENDLGAIAFDKGYSSLDKNDGRSILDTRAAVLFDEISDMSLSPETRHNAIKSFLEEEASKIGAQGYMNEYGITPTMYKDAGITIDEKALGEANARRTRQSSGSTGTPKNQRDINSLTRKEKFDLAQENFKNIINEGIDIGNSNGQGENIGKLLKGTDENAYNRINNFFKENSASGDTDANKLNKIEKYGLGQARDRLEAEKAFDKEFNEIMSDFDSLMTTSGFKDEIRAKMGRKEVKIGSDKLVEMIDGKAQTIKQNDFVEKIRNLNPQNQAVNTNVSKGTRSWGKSAIGLAVGFAIGGGVLNLMMNNKGRMNNAQMYGQQPYSQY